MQTLRLLILLLTSSFAFTAFPYGACIHDPNAALLQQKWKHYHELKKKRAHINISMLVQTIRMDTETLKLLQAVSEVENLIKLVDELESKFFKKAFVDIRFNDMISHPNFLQRLKQKEVDQEIRTSELTFKNDPEFYILLDKIRNEINKSEVYAAIDLFRTHDLGILDNVYRKSAKSALRLIRNKGGTIEAVRSWLTDPPYLRNVPFPSVKLGPFAIRYRTLVAQSVSQFVQDHPITLADAKKAFPRMKQSDVDEMNSIQPPTETNSFDDHVAQIVPDKNQAAIEGVARTLWGEASSCEQQGLAQFEAIARIIADRSLAVKRARFEQQGYAKKSEEVREQNWSTFLKNWVGIKRPAPGLQNKPVNRLRGLSDFGRKEKIDIHEAAQVISKKGQFSVWNSYSLQKYHTGQFNKNIPDAVYEIQGPQAPNDDKALVRILCPEFQNEEQKQLWNTAAKLAEEIVLTPEKLTQRIIWPIGNEILFYTHDAGLSFAKEIKVPHLLVDSKKQLLRGKGRGACNHFRLFVPKIKNQY